MVPPTHTLTLKFNSEDHNAGARGYQEGYLRVVGPRLRLGGLRGPVYCDILFFGVDGLWPVGGESHTDYHS